jgi:phospholipid/cholesterol/gamma-HCH transport system permease protein
LPPPSRPRFQLALARAINRKTGFLPRESRSGPGDLAIGNLAASGGGAFTVEESGAERTLRLGGRLTVGGAREIASALGRMTPDGRPLNLDLSRIERLDMTGAWLLHRTKRQWEEAGSTVTLTGGRDDLADLVEQAGRYDHSEKPRAAPVNPFVAWLAKIGDASIKVAATFGGFLAFLGITLLTLARVMPRPGRWRINPLVHQAEAVAVAALPIVGLMSFLVGVVIAQQGAVQLRQFGAEAFVINLVGRITLRELGVLMTAIMVAGRSGAAFAAQIGSMKLAEEIDAMRTIGMSPVEVLVLPRLLALVFTMPLLAFYASILSLVGGGLFAWVSLGISPASFVQRLQEVVPITDFWITLIKAPLFGVIIAVTGCFQGMQVTGNAESVGVRTTGAVVQSIFLVIVLDAFLAVFFSALGWN